MTKKFQFSAPLLISFVFLVFSLNSGCKNTAKEDQADVGPVFEKVSPSQSGITFNNTVEESYEKNYESFA